MTRIFNPGDFRHKINILQRNPGQDGYGELIDTWSTYATVYASKEPILGNEFFSALTTDNKVEVKFKIRYKKGVTSDMRIQHGLEIYEIIGPIIDIKSMHKELLCYCKLVK